MIKKLLIANRGEIACRIMKTASRLGIKTVAIYSSIEPNAYHVRLADEAYCVGDAPAADSYLNAERIVDIAKQAGVDAIHPGYGFLSERATFAALCAKHHITFVGPPASVIDTMSHKLQAKHAMKAVGIPTLPDILITHQSLQSLSQDILEMGLPILLKANAGGGGKGIRLIQSLADLQDGLILTQQEGLSSFNDPTVFVEKYIASARHIEVQIIMDHLGQAVHLLDRDCSVQRRHQKIMEEAPAVLKPSLRSAMRDAAIQVGKAVGYINAGTVEFLVDDQDNFYFIEMNTRLQVEHPVTEMVTGIDIVEWQLKIASEQPLPLTQTRIRSVGHAFEARIYSEDSEYCLPSTGILSYLSLPETTEQIRIDLGIQVGDLITPYYDHLLLKLIVWEKDRDRALALFEKSLKAIKLMGVRTNVSLLYDICRIPAFAAARIRTHWIAAHRPTKPYLAVPLIYGIAFYLTHRMIHSIPKMEDHYASPWRMYDHWRLIETAQNLSFWHKSKQYRLKIHRIHSRDSATHLAMQYHQRKAQVSLSHQDKHNWTIRVDHEHITFSVFDPALLPAYPHAHSQHDGTQVFVFFEARQYIIDLSEPEILDAGWTLIPSQDCVRMPMPGSMTQIFVKPQQKVQVGERLLLVESMKIEHMMIAPRDGTVKNIYYTIGDVIEEGALLVDFE